MPLEVPVNPSHCICTHRDHQGRPCPNTDFDAQTLLCSTCKTGHWKPVALLSMSQRLTWFDFALAAMISAAASIGSELLEGSGLEIEPPQVT
jgi:hypothetical protein